MTSSIRSDGGGGCDGGGSDVRGSDDGGDDAMVGRGGCYARASGAESMTEDKWALGLFGNGERKRRKTSEDSCLQLTPSTTTH